MTTLRGALAEATSVVRHGAWLLWQHWPMLGTIYLFGQAGRAAALWAAMVTTKWSPTLGALLVPLAPLATVTALILALRAVAPSLRWATFGQATDDTAGSADPSSDPSAVPSSGTVDGEQSAPTEERRASRSRRGSVIEDRLALLASTLIPFFAVYAAQGYLREDTRQFVNETVTDEMMNNSDFWLGNGTLHLERSSIAEGWTFWGIVAVAFALRWLLDRLELPKRHVGWGWLAAYVEVTWVALFAKAAMNKVTEWIDWLKNRQAAVSTQAIYEDVTTRLGGPGEVIDKVVGFVSGAIGHADAVIIVPMAWLTVGAVVYGRSLSQARRREQGERTTAWSARMAKVPAPVRRATREVLAGPIERFQGLAGALRTFARVGLAPMLLFCLVFVLARQAEVGVAWVLRWAIGAHDALTMQTVAPYLNLVVRGVSTVLMVALLAAAVDRILRPDDPPDVLPAPERDDRPRPQPDPTPAPVG